MAVNGSPRNEKSSTSHILTPLLEGMRAAGATTELVHLGKLQIKPCLGCFLCWVKTPGKCVASRPARYLDRRSGGKRRRSSAMPGG
jgi:multimeric flavodoxin WrbA